METKGTCGECEWFPYIGRVVRECMNKENHGTEGMVCWVRADFHGCPRFERRADWVDKAWEEFYNGRPVPGWDDLKSVFRKAAEAEFERRRKET